MTTLTGAVCARCGNPADLDNPLTVCPDGRPYHAECPMLEGVPKLPMPDLIARLPPREHPRTKMLTLPHWMPELDFQFRFHPLFSIELGAMRRVYNVRWYEITRVHIGLLCWRSMWKINFAFNLYKREERT